jgi:hypothetical protein
MRPAKTSCANFRNTNNCPLRVSSAHFGSIGTPTSIEHFPYVTVGSRPIDAVAAASATKQAAFNRVFITV